MNKPQRQHRQHGFTLIEVLVVLVILGLLAGIVGPKILDQLSGAQPQTAKTQIASIKQALDLYKLQNFHYPSNAQGLQALVTRPSGSPEPKNWTQNLDKIPADPWGNPYQYKYPGVKGTVDIFSFGEDGQPGGTGYAADVGNWEL